MDLTNDSLFEDSHKLCESTKPKRKKYSNAGILDFNLNYSELFSDAL